MSTALMADPATTLRFMLPPDVPPRPVHWRSDGRSGGSDDRSEHSAYRLEELTHPCHLLSEGGAMNHCIGRYYADDPRRYGLEPGEPAAAALLAYWVAIEDGDCRVFSFAKGQTTLATMCVVIELGRPVLRELAAKHGHRVNGGEPYFFALMSAIRALADVYGEKVEMSSRLWYLDVDRRPPQRPAGDPPENKAAAQFLLRQSCRAIECQAFDHSQLYIALMTACASRRPPRQVLANFKCDPSAFGVVKAGVTRTELRECARALAWVLWFRHNPDREP